jgi:iron complex outermembrane recepter protein
VSAGGRYTWDYRDSTILRQNYVGGGSTVFGGLGIPFGAPSTDFHGKGRYTKFTPRASISFKPTPDHNIYASYSKGFKGGGFDPRGVGANAPDLNGNGTREQNELEAFLGFNAETVDSYEVGYKASIFEHRLNFAMAAFRADYTDVQIPGSSGCVVGGLATFCGVVTNAGKARFQGLELEANAKLARDFAMAGDTLTFGYSLGYIDAKFTKYITNIASKPTDVSAFRNVQNTPKWTLSGSLAYDAPVGSGHINVNTTVSWRSKTFQFEIPNPYIDQNGYGLWDASLVYRSEGDHWSIGIHGKNLLNQRYKTSGYTFLAANATTGALLTTAGGSFIPSLGKEGVLSAFYGNPRQVFATVGVKF